LVGLNSSGKDIGKNIKSIIFYWIKKVNKKKHFVQLANFLLLR